MRILHKHDATLVRFNDVGYWDDNGEWVDSIAESITPIKCCIQPEFSGAKVQRDLPEGVMEKDCRIVWTHTLLKASSELDEEQADVLRFADPNSNAVERDFEVFELNPWNGAGRIVAWEATVIRRDVL